MHYGGSIKHPLSQGQHFRTLRARDDPRLVEKVLSNLVEGLGPLALGASEWIGGAGRTLFL